MRAMVGGAEIRLVSTPLVPHSISDFRIIMSVTRLFQEELSHRGLCNASGKTCDYSSGPCWLFWVLSGEGQVSELCLFFGSMHAVITSCMFNHCS
jgi:hypothetical protein